MTRHRPHINALILQNLTSSVPYCLCGERLESEAERESGACFNCQAEAAGCTNGRPYQFVPRNPITRAEIEGALLRSFPV